MPKKIGQKLAVACAFASVAGLGGGMAYGIVETGSEARAAANACENTEIQCSPEQQKRADRMKRAEKHAFMLQGGGLAMMVAAVTVAGTTGSAPNTPKPTPAPTPKPYKRTKSMRQSRKRA